MALPHLQKKDDTIYSGSACLEFLSLVTKQVVNVVKK
jgi:hypothetical protein